MSQPTEKSLALITNYVKKNCARTGLQLHPMEDVSEAVITGLAMHLDQLKRPLCPCRFYPDKQVAVDEREWLCPCADMKHYKYCHCMLFVTESGMPVTEHLPEDHEGRLTYGLIADPAPDKWRRIKKESE
ncbi:ferredoxin-thioredoxin reductase catalytic domain-containing protein [Maridesulfovibrio sp.]|uniref:ferredoxin-thioredoxin reductase catalytic domain-containing protein n=1 Tax=Maridesulfovibrio sp. TaxID=2795000 RepID=UPI002A18E28B|nr:ferredoxin-thioredoxin reductase catalytic domain-containing protein [Maridesulfovibrio sp.]